MNYIIDGHNLIMNIPELDLSMPDDEQRLVELLVEFCSQGKQRVEVFFDGAPVGQAGARNYGRVKAYFVAQSQTADDAIRLRLKRLGREVKNWTVVSSDRAVQAAAREIHAGVLGSEEFTLELRARRSGGEGEIKPGDEGPLSEAEVKKWEDIFKKQRKNRNT